MQAIATENNLSETAFFVPRDDGSFHIRWFSPKKEIAFCGHATLASAHIMFEGEARGSSITFWADAVGELTIKSLVDDAIGEGAIEMSFPNREPEPVPVIPLSVITGLSIEPKEVLKNQQAYVVVYENELQVRDVIPDLVRLKELGPLDVAVTAPGENHDFVSRYFWPANGGDEDPVTGSIHAGLAPYWAKRLNKTALQASRRSGLLKCRVDGSRVHVAGTCVKYLQGTIEI
jgi:PhzF family phenazine biosynthesis protein